MRGLGLLFTGSKTRFSDALNAEEKKTGRRLFRHFFTLNGISVGCLMNHVLVLYAIRNGLNDAMVAVMASFVHLTMPFMLVAKPAISRFGAARVRGLGWFLRYISATFLVFVPVLAATASQTVTTGLVMTSTFGFAVFRALGMAAHTPLLGEVTEPAERGSFLSQVMIRNEISYLFTMLFIIIVLRFLDELWVYQVIIGVGCAVGFYASTIIVRVPESTAPFQSAKKPYAEILSSLWKNVRSRKLMFAWCAAMVSHVVIVPFMIIAVKNGYDVSDFAALGFALILILGGVVSGYVNRKISDLFQARTLLIVYCTGLMAVAVFWSLAPAVYIPLAIGIVFFVAGFCKMGAIIGINKYFLETVSPVERVGNALIMRIASGAAAGLGGSVVGGGLLGFLSGFNLDRLDVYRCYFLIILGLLGLLLLILRKLENN
jgi:hypothetical protein